MTTDKPHEAAMQELKPLRLTLLQRKMLSRINVEGYFGYKPQEYNFSSKTRLCKKLVSMGLAYDDPHGGFSITEAGKKILATPIGFETPLTQEMKMMLIIKSKTGFLPCHDIDLPMFRHCCQDFYQVRDIDPYISVFNAHGIQLMIQDETIGARP